MCAYFPIFFDGIHPRIRKISSLCQSLSTPRPHIYPTIFIQTMRLFCRGYFRTTANCSLHRFPTPKNAQRSRADSRHPEPANHSLLHPQNQLGRGKNAFWWLFWLKFSYLDLINSHFYEILIIFAIDFLPTPKICLLP
jgi:hypothetical protein